MDIKNTFLRSQGIKDKFDNDLFTDLQKDISNWTATGDGNVTINYNNKINILTFDAVSSGTDAQNQALFNQTLQSLYGKTLTQYQFTEYNFWNTMKESIDPLVTYTEGAYIGFTLISKSNYSISGNNLSVTGNRKTAHLSGTGSLSSFGNVSSTYTFQNANPYEWGLISEFGVPFEKDYTLNFAVEANKKYVLQLNQLTSTGYDKDSSIHDITLTNDTDTYTIDFNNTISQEYNKKSIFFTANSTTASLKLNLRGMKGTGINLNIKDISLYELN